MSSKKQRIGWYLFDFSGEILMTNGGLYFLPWLTNDIGFSDKYFALALILTSIIFLTTGPFLGRLYDQSRHKNSYLWLTSFIIFIATIGIHLANRLIPTASLKGIIGLACFSILMFSYQLSLIFYNSILSNLTSSHNFTKISSLGAATGWTGALLGIFLVLPFVDGNVPFFDGSGNSQAFLPSACFFAFGTIVSLFLMRGVSDCVNTYEAKSAKLVFQQTWRELWMISKKKNMYFFLLAMFLFSDAVLTIEDFASPYLVIVMRYSENAKAGLFALFLIMAALGAIISANVATRIKPKKILVLILIGWIITLSLVSVTKSQIVFTMLFGIVGILFGALGGVMRAFYLLLLPRDQTGQYFGLFASFQRFSTLIGPLVWVGVARGFPKNGVPNYRLSMLAMAGLIAVSLLFLKKVSDTSENNS